MKKKKGTKFFLTFLFLMFILYVGLYIASASGYYESKLSQKTYLTNEEIKQFEKDVKLGKNVSIKKYMSDKNYNYNNKFSNAGISFSNGVERFMSVGIIKSIDVLKKLFT